MKVLFIFSHFFCKYEVCNSYYFHTKRYIYPVAGYQLRLANVFKRIKQLYIASKLGFLITPMVSVVSGYEGNINIINFVIWKYNYYQH